MDWYKVSLMRYGYIITKADSKEEAAQKALTYSEKEVHWLSESDGFSGPYLITLTEKLPEAAVCANPPCNFASSDEASLKPPSEASPVLKLPQPPPD